MYLIIDSRSASLSFPRLSNLSFQFQLRLLFTAGHWDSISLNSDSFYHWSLQFASSNRKAVNHFPAQIINCHKLRIYKSVIRKCCAPVIIYRLYQATRWLLWLALLQAKLINRACTSLIGSKPPGHIDMPVGITIKHYLRLP